ncbi:PREDICTED: ATP-dependent RNA helicase DDX24 [Thamnophis sirtalis]|uniref:ATP-dependent RNA helicase n=1 Tax=Thamnophis sirtalis TaxID=35019 RepID=A0A6I9YQH4_9SAUR|nr:PREDICTED: ATP-dependent RNA helicase DDX24 [Thamnophis sirtalis]
MKPKRNKFKASSKPKQRGIKVTGQWKPIEIDPNLFADEQLGGIICFEELANYKLVSSLKEGEEKAAKRKRNDEDLEKLCPATPPKKRKKGKKIEHGERKKEELEIEEKVTQQDASCEKALVEYEQDDYEPTEVTGLERNLPQKKKKGKKKKSRSPQNVLEPTGASKKANNWAAKVLSTKSDHKTDVSAWKSLFVPKPVLLALSELGFSTPTPIQALTLPSAIRDSMDILGAAETGSGKTLAFAIPVIHSILQWYSSENMTSGMFEEAADSEDEMAKQQTSEETRLNSDTDETNASADDNGSVAVNSMELLQDPGFDVGSPKQNSVKNKNNPLLGLVLTPTRELAVQVKHHIDAVAKFTVFNFFLKSHDLEEKSELTKFTQAFLNAVSFPDTLYKNFQIIFHPSDRCLVIDEADRMVEKGHFLELSQLLEMLSDTQHNPKRQIFVFSATLTLIHQAPTRVLQKKNAVKIDRKTKLEMLMQKVGIRGKPKVIDLTRKEATVETLTETRIHCDTEEKDYYLYYFLLQYPGRTMVFANSIDCIKRLTALLTIMDCNPLPLHANMHQKQRLKNLERFAEQNSCPLLTTDVAARGLDIPYVQHVIHYQVPRTSELYVHRSGRTARAANEGLSLLLIGPHDLINFKKIYKTLKKDEELPFFPVEAKYMSAIKERVNLARQIEKIEYFNSRAKHENSWLQQAAEALELDLDDDELTGGQFTEREESEKHRMLKGMKKQLKHLLNQPVFRGLMKTKYPTQSGKLVLSDYTGQHSQSALSAISKAQVKKVKKK